MTRTVPRAALSAVVVLVLAAPPRFVGGAIELLCGCGHPEGTACCCPKTGAARADHCDKGAGAGRSCGMRNGQPAPVAPNLADIQLPRAVLAEASTAPGLDGLEFVAPLSGPRPEAPSRPPEAPPPRPAARTPS
jgi:hypothetical protein